MARQKAIVFTNWKQDVDGSYYAALQDNLQAAESLMFASDMFVSGVPTTAELCIVEVWADETRISLLNGTIHFVAARQYFDMVTNGDTNQWYNDPFTAAEVTALSSWLTTKTGATNSQIAAWFDTTPAALSNWLQNNPRLSAFKKLYTTWHEWTN